MIAQFEAALEIAKFMDARRWEYCLIGGLAVQQWGEPRTTLDADFTLLVGWGNEEPFVDELLRHFKSRIPDARLFALQRRVLLLQATNGIKVDIALGALDFEEAMTSRARTMEFSPEVRLRCCTAEDLFIMKAFSSRVRDWSDLESIAARQQSLDTDYIFRHLTVLCELKETPEIVVRAKALLKRSIDESSNA